MTRLTRLAVLLLLVFVCLSSAEDEATDIVQLLYARETITAARGSSVKLSCEAYYDYKRCDGLHVAWNKQGTELRDPRKYLTTVSETVIKDSMVHRRIVTEILDLQQDDGGEYQCSAECDKVVEAVGHVILIDVQTTDIVEVYCAKETITAGSGSSVKLSCEARYDFKRCDGLHVAWNKQGVELRDPRKYLISMIDTVFDVTMRRRQVVTEILDLQQDDGGEYQCSAECDKVVEAVGHVILLNVRESATDIVKVFYAKETIAAASSSSVKLSCEARYDFKRCNGLRAAWKKQNTELRDPRKYFTTFTDTVMKDNMRSRQIVTEILDLQLDDSGDYQCSAKCDKEGEEVGHFISIAVQSKAGIMEESYFFHCSCRIYVTIYFFLWNRLLSWL